MQKVVEQDGLKWVARPASDDHIAYGTVHEPFLVPLILDLLPQGGILVDVGSHVGMVSLRCAARASHVYAFEPQPDNRAGLEENIKLNSITNVTVVPFAASDRTGPTTMNLNGGSSKLGELGVQIEAIKLDDYVFDGRISVAKMDIEGHEGPALRGWEQTMRRDKFSIILELHDKLYGETVWHETLAALRSADYTWHHIADYGAGRYFRCDPCNLI